MAADRTDLNRSSPEGGGNAIEKRVRLLPAEGREPLSGRRPVFQARRWRSGREGEASRAVDVFVTPHAFVRFCAHAGSDLDNEVGGILLGQWRVDSASGRQYIVVEAALRARHTRQGSAFLTFTSDSLVALHEEKDERYPAKELVGWYHTHPRMGVFLSGHDLWLHEHFFPEPWQVALVIEPHSGSGGFFVRETDGHLDAHLYSGFYELKPRGSSSVVHWKNLEPEAALERAQGGTPS